MPIVMKSSNNGFVDAKKKIVQLPDYLQPKPLNKPDGMRRLATAASAAVLGLAAMVMGASSAKADVVSLTATPGAAATMNTGNTGTQGVNSLTVNGVQNVKDQWFYFRVGTGPGAFAPISSLTQMSINKPISQGGTEPNNQVLVTYSGSYAPPAGGTVPFTISALYSLGASTNGASLAQTVTVNDTSSTAALPISIIEYNDYDLNGSAANDSVAITGGNTATQTKSGSTVIAAEINSTPPPTEFQAALSPTLQTAITSPTFTTLNGTSTTGPGDASFGFEWDTTVAAAGSYIISKTSTLSNVPEPASGMLVLGGMSLFGLRRRRTASRA
jgi:hypothetical protein